MTSSMFLVFSLLSCAAHVYGTAQGGCTGTTVWEKFENILQSGGAWSEDGNADEESCFDQCKDSSACFAFDWHPTEANGQFCFIHAVENGRIGSFTGITHYRKRTIDECPEATYYNVQTCLIYEIWNYMGMFPYSTSTVDIGDASKCGEACLADALNCVAFDYHDSLTADNCRLYDASDAFDVMSTGESGSTDSFGFNFYYFDDCGGDGPLRDPATQGFHLRAEQQAASGATATMGGTFNQCWDTCFSDIACLAFGWIDSSMSCITYDETNINTTVATPGTFHHVLFDGPGYEGGTAPVAPDYPALEPSAANCFHVVEEKENTRGYALDGIVITPIEAGNSNYLTCAEECLKKSDCAAFDFVDSERPFKGNRCYYYNAVPSITGPQADRHQFLVSLDARTACPSSSASVSANSCTWEQYDETKGLFGTGLEVDTATTVDDCFTACVNAGYGCGAIDFTTANLCTLYPREAAYFYEEAGANTDTTHYVRSSCP